MAPVAIGFLAMSRRGSLAGFYRRPELSARESAADGVRRTSRSPQVARTSWITRHQALWARALEPVRPLDAPRAPVTPWDASWPLTRELTSARRARRLVTEQLDDWSLEGLADTAELLVSELVTNALRHTRGPLRLNLCVRGSRLRCEVEDTDPAGPVRRVVDADAEGGRGTELLDLLAEAWGSTRMPTGKTMWFEMPKQTPA
jgi:hypothetical protein